MAKQPITLAVRFPEKGGKSPVKALIKEVAQQQGKSTNRFIVDAVLAAIAAHNGGNCGL